MFKQILPGIVTLGHGIWETASSDLHGPNWELYMTISVYRNCFMPLANSSLPGASGWWKKLGKKLFWSDLQIKWKKRTMFLWEWEEWGGKKKLKALSSVQLKILSQLQHIVESLVILNNSWSYLPSVLFILWKLVQGS